MFFIYNKIGVNIFEQIWQNDFLKRQNFKKLTFKFNFRIYNQIAKNPNKA